jgi:hypothetical protein
MDRKDDEFRPKSYCIEYDPGHILQRQQNASTTTYILHETDQTQKSSVRYRSHYCRSIEPSYLTISRSKCHLTPLIGNSNLIDSILQLQTRRTTNPLEKNMQVILTRQHTCFEQWTRQGKSQKKRCWRSSIKAKGKKDKLFKKGFTYTRKKQHLSLRHLTSILLQTPIVSDHGEMLRVKRLCYFA